MSARLASLEPLLREDAFRRLLLWSVAGHVFLLLVLVIGPPRFRRPLPPAPLYIEVLPQEGIPAPPAPAAPSQLVEEAIVIPPVPRAKPTPPPPKPKPEPKVEEPPKPKVVEEAAKEPPKKSVNELLAEIRKNVEKRPDEAKAGAVIGGGSGAIEGILDAERARYHKKLRNLLNSNWTAVGAMSKRDAQVRFVVKISEVGNVLEIEKTHGSDNRFLDESAERAIRKSDPFPPPPPGYTTIPIRFDPEGVL